MFGLQASAHGVFGLNITSFLFLVGSKQLAEEALFFPTWILCWLSGCYQLKETPWNSPGTESAWLPCLLMLYIWYFFLVCIWVFNLLLLLSTVCLNLCCCFYVSLSLYLSLPTWVCFPSSSYWWLILTLTQCSGVCYFPLRQLGVCVFYPVSTLICVFLCVDMISVLASFWWAVFLH